MELNSIETVLLKQDAELKIYIDGDSWLAFINDKYGEVVNARANSLITLINELEGACIDFMDEQYG